MGRPIKTGLDYFPLDTSWDIKMKLLKAKFHLLGIGCMTELFKDIYHEGYALKWDDDTKLLFANDNSIDLKELEEIVKFAFSKGIFSQDIFDKTGFLTSHGIQARWKKACVDSKRNNIEIERSLDLLSKVPEETPQKDHQGEFPPEETPYTPEETKKTPVESTQRKGKESKEEESKIKDINPPSFFVSESGSVISLSGSGRIETARKLWNLIGCIPESQRTVTNFKPDDRSECLKTINSFSDDEIAESIKNYKMIQSSPEHEITMPYGSFQGFLKGGVDKFVTSANPLERYKKRTQPQKPAKQGMITNVDDIEF